MSLSIRRLVKVSRSQVLEDDQLSPDLSCHVAVVKKGRIELDEEAAATVVGCLAGPVSPGSATRFRGYIAGDATQLVNLMQCIGFSLANDTLSVTPPGRLSGAQQLFDRLRRAFSLGLSQALLQEMVERP